MDGGFGLEGTHHTALKSMPGYVQSVYATIPDSGEVAAQAIKVKLGLSLATVNSCLSRLLEAGLVSERVTDTGDLAYVRGSIEGATPFPWEKGRDGPRIVLPHQFPMLCDHARLTAFSRAIRAHVQSSDIVADLGAGSGILSAIAAQSAKKVFSVEIDPHVGHASHEFLTRYYPADSVEHILGDARYVRLPEQVDVVICEMLDTALVAELQVPVMNRAIQMVLKPGGRVIPSRAITTVQAVHVDWSIEGFEIQMPYFQAHGARKPLVELSAEIPYHDVSFYETNELLVDASVEVPITEPGTANALRITTYVYLDENIMIGPSPEPHTWLNPPYIIPIDNKPVASDDNLGVRLSYELGGGWQSLEHSVWRLAATRSGA